MNFLNSFFLRLNSWMLRLKARDWIFVITMFVAFCMGMWFFLVGYAACVFRKVTV
jgi:hypothetical protein